MTRDFRLLWAGQTVSWLGTATTQVAAPLVAVTTLHASAFQVGLLAAAVWLPWVLVGVPAGTLVDRLPRRPILVTCDLVSAVLLVSAPVAAWLGLVFLVREVGLGAGMIGLLLSLASLGGVAGAMLSGPVVRRLGSARGLFALEVASGLSALLIPLTTGGAGLAWLVVGNAGVAAFVVAGNVISASFRQRYCPPELLGRVTASMRVLNYGTMPVAAVVAGALATAVGLRTTMWVGTAGVLAAALLLLVGPLTRSRDLPETWEPREARELPQVRKLPEMA